MSAVTWSGLSDLSETQSDIGSARYVGFSRWEGAFWEGDVVGSLGKSFYRIAVGDYHRLNGPP